MAVKVDGVTSPAKVDGLAPGKVNGVEFWTSFIDDFDRSNRPLAGDNGWVSGSTSWNIVGNVVVNTPGNDGELATDPGLEGTYTGGLNGSLTLHGTPTVADAGAGDAHGGSHAQQMLADAQYEGVKRLISATQYKIYRASIWGKRTAGTGNLGRSQLGRTGVANDPLVDTSGVNYYSSSSYVQRFKFFRSQATESVIFYLALEYGTSFDTLVVDDYSFVALTLNNLFAVQSCPTQDVICKVALTRTGFLWSEVAGVVVNLDSYSSPANFVVGYVFNATAYMDKCVAGVYTNVASGAVTYGDGKVIKIEKSGSTYKLYYGTAGSEAQVDTDKTISDAGIIDNKYHGVYSWHSTYALNNFSVEAN